MNITKEMFSPRVIAEIAVFVSLATVLSRIELVDLSRGAVTAASMLPILWLTIRRGPKIGILSATLYGVIQLAFDPIVYNPIQVLLDYPVAYGLLGVAGFFQKRPFIGICLGTAGRFVALFVSGVVFAPTQSPLGMNVFEYSAVYNGFYVGFEFLIVAYIFVLLMVTKTLKIYM